MVIVKTMKGSKVIRKRSSKDNVYYANGKRLSAMGASVPEEVSKILRLGPSNFQNQLDGPYWLSLSPGLIAKELNKLADLSVLDRLQAGAIKAVRAAKAEEESLIKQTDATESKLKKLQWVQKCGREFDELDALFTSWQETDTAQATLQILCDKLERKTKRYNRSNQKADSLSLLATKAKELDQLSKKEFRLQTLTDLLSKAKQPKDPSKDFVNVELARDAGDKAAEDWRQLQMYIEEHAERVERLKRKQAELESAKQDLNQSGVCPTCHQPLPSPTLARTSISRSKIPSSDSTLTPNPTPF